MWSVECKVWSVKCGVGSVKCRVGSVKCGVPHLPRKTMRRHAGNVQKQHLLQLLV